MEHEGAGARTFLSAATGSEKRVGKKFESPARSDIAADKNVRQECPRAGKKSPPHASKSGMTVSIRG
jgi:hypothetical protein